LFEEAVYENGGSDGSETHLSELLKRVSKRETIRITRWGLPVAKLVPSEGDKRGDLKKVVREIREIREEIILGDSTLRELINDGRRH
jgi:antitoxin (DNA-binding transcriptional repressor) of toxin-antitoxin stability system